MALQIQDGLNRVSDRVHAFMQFEGGWGANNVAFFTDHGESVLIDALCDLPRMRRMLGALRASEPAAKRIDNIVLTHWHCDHVNGICEDTVTNSRVYSTQICARTMEQVPWIDQLNMFNSLEGTAKRSMDGMLRDRYDFTGLTYRAPDVTFNERLELPVGASRVVLLETRPSHTESDSLVYIPDEGVVHVGDLIGLGMHLGVQWPYPSHLLQAVELMLSLDAEHYIPGHGRRLMRPRDVANVKAYLEHMIGRGRECYDKSMTFEQAYEHILRHELGPYQKLGNPSSVYFLCQMMFDEFAGRHTGNHTEDWGKFLATSDRVAAECPVKFPHLFPAAPVASAAP